MFVYVCRIDCFFVFAHLDLFAHWKSLLSSCTCHLSSSKPFYAFFASEPVVGAPGPKARVGRPRLARPPAAPRPGPRPRPCPHLPDLLALREPLKRLGGALRLRQPLGQGVAAAAPEVVVASSCRSRPALHLLPVVEAAATAALQVPALAPLLRLLLRAFREVVQP